MKSRFLPPPAAWLLAALLPLTGALGADPSPAPSPPPEAPLHELGAGPSPASPAALAPAPDATVTPRPTAEPTKRHHHHGNGGDDDDGNRVAVDDEAYVAANEVIPGNAVAVLGPVAVDGTVEGNAVSVLGSHSRIDGTVHGNVVAILGTLRLGPHAHIDGNVVVVGGVLNRDPAAFVGGNVVQQHHGITLGEDSEATSWWHNGVGMGRPLAIGPHLHLFWLFTVAVLFLYTLVALVFPRGVQKCGDLLSHRPGMTILTGVLSLIAVPVVFVLLLITIVGIPLAFVLLPLAVFCATLFGKASIFAVIGRPIVGKDTHPALATLVGGLLLSLFYLIPVLGGLLWVVVTFLGFSCAMAALLAPVRQSVALQPPAVPPAAPPVAPVPGAPVSGAPVSPVEAGLAVPAPDQGAPAPASPVVEPGIIPPAAPALATALPALTAPPAAVLPPVISAPPHHGAEALLPRAGFWIRMVALLIDVILIGVVTQMHDMMLPVLAGYGAVLWKFRGATLGGIIFGLKVVRLDSRPVDWPTAIVRALACFISLVILGLGFIWIAFDRDRQAWHDKIAGTVVVRLPKSVPLV